MNFTEKVKEKREFSELPDSIIKRASGLSKGDFKETRNLLRKYFGVFLTNRVLKGRGSFGEILNAHKSSQKRNYKEFYPSLFNASEEINSVVDLGAGVNGFSYPYLKETFGSVDYVAIEAAGQLVDQMNEYFKKEKFSARAYHKDILDVDEILKLVEKQEKPCMVFMFQLIDALETFERNFSKGFILKLLNVCDKIILTMPMESLSGKKVRVSRKWLVDFLERDTEVERDFLVEGERILVIRKK